MQFNSLEYAIFLVVVFLVYWALARTGLLRILFLVVASYVFYAASNPWFLLLIIASTITDYFAGLGMSTLERARADAEASGDGDAERRLKRKRKLILIGSLVFNLGMLGVFKYTNFFYESAVDVANGVFDAGWEYERLNILLPAGISFYTFQTMSYSIDVYRGLLIPERNFFKFAFFVGFFPQLVAGPIVRAVDFMHQIDRRPFVSREQVSRAMWLIGVGLFKKVVVADYLAVNLVDRVFDRPDLFSSAEVMLSLYGYTMQVYMDFSAYTDIAIGSALLIGFHLPDNFDRPYLAISVRDFWRRWHKTLGSWLRDYIYYPLGGARRGDLRVYFNLFVTFVLIGLWHGASWTFVVYGCLHASAMCLDRFIRKTVRKGKVPHIGLWGHVWRIFLTLHFIVLCRILFRSQTFEEAGNIFDIASLPVQAIFDPALWPDEGKMPFDVTNMTPWLWVLLVGSFVVHWTPRKWVDGIGTQLARLPFPVQGALFAGAIMLINLAASSDVVPFIYFQF